jgi:hypothetical protein
VIRSITLRHRQQDSAVCRWRELAHRPGLLCSRLPPADLGPSYALYVLCLPQRFDV